METRPRTIILDIDGCILHHFGSPSKQIDKVPKILDGVKEVLDEWDNKSYRVILLTGRKESMRNVTEKQLQSCGIYYDQLVMGVGNGTRVLVNDLKPSASHKTAIAVNLERNKGIRDLKNL